MKAAVVECRNSFEPLLADRLVHALVPAVLCIFLANAASAQDNSAPPPAATTPAPDTHTAAALDYLAATDAKTGMLPIIDSVVTTYADRVSKLHPTVSDSALSEFKTELRAKMIGDLDELMHLQAAVFAAHFSEAELRSITEFYRSPAGQKWITRNFASNEPYPYGEMGSARTLHAADNDLADLKLISRFFKSDLGMKLQNTGPAISNELKPINAQWIATAGRRDVQQVVAALHQKGVEL